MIYRLFITPMALLKLIIVRFHWALVDDSPQRQIVRIRTFVTLRHWLLNYFEFDFMRSKDLRQTLGLYLRSLTSHPRVTNSMREQRIVKELRRYVQSLKTIHYRKLAQQKLERKSRKQQQQQQQLLVERRGRLQARRSSAGRRGIFNLFFCVMPGMLCMMIQHSWDIFVTFDFLTWFPPLPPPFFFFFFALFDKAQPIWIALYQEISFLSRLRDNHPVTAPVSS